MTNYLTAFYDHLTNNNVYNRLSSSMESESRDHSTLIEPLNREITQACQHTENEYQRRHMTYWTVNLHQAKLKLSIWYQIRSQMCCKLPITTIVHHAKQWDITYPTGCTSEIVNNEIAALKTEIRDIHKQSHDKRPCVSKHQ